MTRMILAEEGHLYFGSQKSPHTNTETDYNSALVRLTKPTQPVINFHTYFNFIDWFILMLTDYPTSLLTSAHMYYIAVVISIRSLLARLIISDNGYLW